MGQVRTAIAGVGSCASSLVQMIALTRSGASTTGVMFDDIGGYRVEDIEIVACFDVDKAKIGLDLADAIRTPLTAAAHHSDVPLMGIRVEVGPVLDGIEGELVSVVAIDPASETVDMNHVSQRLVESGADVLVCLLPTGATEAVRSYARAAAEAGVAFVNATPEAVAVDPGMAELFAINGAPILGDDLRSHVGATTLHTALIEMLHSRGVAVVNTYQLNVGGNTDFLNLSDPVRSASKRQTKRNALAAAGIDSSDVAAGPNGYVRFLNDTKHSIIRIEAESVLGSALTLDVRLEVEDSPNAAGPLISALRLAKTAADQGRSGAILEVCPTLFKNPPVGATESQGLAQLRAFVAASASDR